jgi:predicted phosphodiesterase
MKVGLIGDVHGKWRSYAEVLDGLNSAGCDITIQLGDMGVGFGPAFGTYEQILSNHDTLKGVPGFECMSDPRQVFGRDDRIWVRGNHDNPAVCKSFPSWVKDGTIRSIGSEIFMFVGGGLSIDKEWRTEGYDWWADEELSYQDLSFVIDLYDSFRPDVMITHDGPDSVIFEKLFKGRLLEKRSRTGAALQTMFDIHKPKKWYFGHFHMHRREVIDGCEFVCLEELQTDIIEV